MVYHGFSETGLHLKYKIIFSRKKTSYSYYLHRTMLCAAVSPPDDGPF